MDQRPPVIAFDDVPGSAQPVVFSHGVFMNRTMFTPQLQAFAGAHRCLAWDARCHGETQWAGEFTLWDSARDLIALLERRDVDRAVLVGMSQGGLVSIMATLLAPERVAGLVMLDSQAGPFSAAGAERFFALADTWRHGGPTEADLDYLADLILGEGVDDLPWRRAWREMAPRAPGDAVAALINRDDLRPRLGEVACPVLVIHGGADRATPLERAQQVAESVPDSRGLVLIPGAPHAANLSHPLEVNAAIARFLTEIRG